MRRPVLWSLVLATALPLVAAGPALAGGPVIERGRFQDTFFDEFIFDLCGIVTETTQTQRWTAKVFPDGSETVQVVRSFVSVDPRLPVEKAAGTTFTAPDGSRRVVGKPIQLIGPGGGVTLIDAGWIAFDAEGEVSDQRGPHPSIDADLAEFYCPS